MCSRKFNPASFEKHVRICQKVFAEKRKPVDMKAKRVEGAVAERDKGFGQEYSRPFPVKEKRKGGGPGGRS